jgi:hypothetical protein
MDDRSSPSNRCDENVAELVQFFSHIVNPAQTEMYPTPQTAGETSRSELENEVEDDDEGTDGGIDGQDREQKEGQTNGRTEGQTDRQKERLVDRTSGPTRTKSNHLRGKRRNRAQQPTLSHRGVRSQSPHKGDKMAQRLSGLVSHKELCGHSAAAVRIAPVHPSSSTSLPTPPSRSAPPREEG